VLDTIRRFHDTGVWVEVSTPVAPGVDNLASLRTIARHLAGIGQIPWHLIRFSPAYRQTEAPPTAVETLARAVRIGHDEGLHHVYVERALGDEGRRTRCPECATTVIDRDVWSLRRVGLREGRCPHCSSPVPGRWI
jgi:pyruvate formate lyase activating enzyme